MVVLLAKAAPVGVILRRGPTQWWHVTLWDTKRDTFELGQWFHGRIYPEKCDVSPDGKLWIYFVGRWTNRAAAGGYSSTWTAVARPPYLTALALWPIGDTHGGAGIFVDDRSVMVNHYKLQHHPDHPPGPLRVLTWEPCLEDGRQVCSSFDTDWQGQRDVRKSSGELKLGREWPPHRFAPTGTATPYTLFCQDGKPLTTFDAHWADWDQQGRLVATVGGRVVAGNLTRDKRLVWQQLADLHEEQPTVLEAPDWAQRWTPLPRGRRRHKSIPDSPHRE
jgi:hypothetical protein